MASTRQSASNLSLAILLQCSCYWFVLYVLFEMACFIWKNYTLPYPDDIWGTEFFLLWLFM